VVLQYQDHQLDLVVLETLEGLFVPEDLEDLFVLVVQ
jgi:hypothetical protein